MEREAVEARAAEREAAEARVVEGAETGRVGLEAPRVRAEETTHHQRSRRGKRGVDIPCRMV